MEGLRQLSQSAFDSSQKFIKAGHSQTFESFEVSDSISKGPCVKRGYLVETELSEWAAAWETTTEATLKIVCLTSEQDASLNVSRDVFSKVMANIAADPSVLYMICHTKDGFHYFPGNPQRNSPLLPTWFVGTSRYAVLWTFDTIRRFTRGLVIERQRHAFKGLTDVLENFKDCIHAPQVMCLVIPLYRLHTHDSRTESALNDMRVIEKSIGFGPRKGQGHWQGDKNGHSGVGSGITSFTIDEILVLSQKVHEVAGKIKNSDRLRRSSVRMLDDILFAHRAAAAENSETDNYREKYCSALQKLSEAVPVVQRQMYANADYLAYMQYRAENLSQVVSDE